MDALVKAELQRHLLKLHGLELERLLADTLRQQGYFVQSEVSTKDGQIDLMVTRMSERLAVEVARRATLTHDHVNTALSYFANIEILTQRVIAFPGVATLEAQRVAASHNVLLWGLDVWAQHLEASGKVTELLGLIPPKEFLRDVDDNDVRRRVDNLLARLSGIEPGETTWSEYQAFTADAAEFLFAPELSAPDRESSDSARRNRRDFVMENHAEAGFWFRARQRYGADYVVFDAKNQAVPIRKKSIIEMAHYLKPYGLGMFGILLVRSPPSQSAIHAMREQWAGSGRMIIAIPDAELRRMLERKGSGLAPEYVVSDTIARMRKSM